jgi:REP element-mobilizing transposase RayT
MTKNIKASESEPGTEKELPWLQDVNRAVQILTGLSLGFSAQAALITRDNDLWAYAGQLPKESARELGSAVARYWDKNSESDLVRFIRLETTSAEHKMYSTRLAKDMVLSLVFDAETPFSTIRTQAGQLVRSLSKSPTNQDPSENGSADLKTLNLDTFTNILSKTPTANPSKSKPSQNSGPDRLEIKNPSSFSPSDESPPPSHSSYSSDTNPGKSGFISEPVESSEAEEPDISEPSPISETGRRVKFEQVSQAMYNLNYACLMIPRFPSHPLSGDLAVRLSEWVPKLCIAFAWRLEFISITPDYLQWIVNVPPTTAPGYLMRIVRQHLSEKVFADFPRLKSENPSGDFWAPGYIIVGGNHPHPARLVKDFIEQTRFRQGIT